MAAKAVGSAFAPDVPTPYLRTGRGAGSSNGLIENGFSAGGREAAAAEEAGAGERTGAGERFTGDREKEAADNAPVEFED